MSCEATQKPSIIPTACRNSSAIELSGGILYCGECGCGMAAHTTRDRGRGKSYPYYHCTKSRQYGEEACSHRKFYKAEALETAVWGTVCRILKVSMHVPKYKTA